MEELNGHSVILYPGVFLFRQTAESKEMGVAIRIKSLFKLCCCVSSDYINGISQFAPGDTADNFHCTIDVMSID